jgi:catechol 2,3-dioxygenase-like lactoylglutathione lyase family enzyme
MCFTDRGEKEEDAMAKIRHIAIRSEDTEATARFFVEVFGLELVQRRGHGPIDLTDGDVNITVLPMNLGGDGGREIRPGVEHIGFSVADEAEEAERKERLEAAGARELNPVHLGDVYYESKYLCGPGLVIDVGQWRGGSPVERPAATAGKARKK